jgi:hypothetical protein
VQEEDVGDDFRHDGLCWSGSKSVQNASSHEGVVGVGLSAPDGRSEVDQLREEVYGAAAKGRADWHPTPVLASFHFESNRLTR